MQLSRCLVVLVALLAASTNAASLTEQKQPTRSKEAVTVATRAALTGYQGKSTTKNAKPRKPIVEQKKPQRSANAVRKATVLASHGYQGESTTKKKK